MASRRLFIWQTFAGTTWLIIPPDQSTTHHIRTIQEAKVCKFSTRTGTFRYSEIDNFKIYLRQDDVKDLSVIKHFPYYLLLHSILVLWPMILWKKFYAVEAKRKLDFLISGMEEGITSIVAGLANDTTWDRDEESIKVYGHLIFVAEIILIFG